MDNFYNASDVKQELAPQIQDVVKDLYPEARRNGAEMSIGNVDGDKGKSLSISLSPDKNGQWIDFASGDSGDIFTLVEMKYGITFTEAVAMLADRFTKVKPSSDIRINLNTKVDYQVVNPDDHTLPLSDIAIQKIYERRGITEEVLRQYDVRVASSGKSEIAFLYYLHKACVKIHFAGLYKKTFHSTVNPANVLYGKEWATPDRCSGVLVITEGQWDALSYAQAGIPAVSIPSGVKNDKWIELDWEYLQRFHTFVISFDQDDSGIKATDAITRRLGVSKCKIASLPLKDANDVLRDENHGCEALVAAIEHATPYQPEEIKQGADLLDDAWSMMSDDRNNIGQALPFDIPFKLRPHEMTLFTGFRGHGKSTVVYNIVAWLAGLGIPSMTGSFETISAAVVADIITNYSGKAVYKSREEFNKEASEIADFVHVYNSTLQPTPRHLLEVFKYAHTRYGVSYFVIDNVATMKIDRGDNVAQAEAANMFRDFVNEFPVHLMLVAHPRKSSDGGYEGPPQEGDVRGASEWTDYAHNIVAVWRNKKKAEILDEARDNDVSDIKIQQLDDEMEDGKIIVRKQRFSGVDSFTKVFFNQQLKLYSKHKRTYEGLKTKIQANETSGTN